MKKLLTILLLSILSFATLGLFACNEGPSAPELVIDKTVVIVEEGKTDKITATADRTVYFSSDDTSIATISDTGVVTGIASGSTTVKAYIVYEGGTVTKSAVVVVTVRADIDIITPIINVNKNATAQIVTTSTSTLGYTSNNPLIATVSNTGVVTGVSKGSTTIKVSLGSTEKTVQVTVLEPSFNLNPTSFSGYEGDTFTLTLVDKVDISGAPTFTSSNSSIASVTNTGEVTLHSAGKAEITVTCSGVTKKARVTVRESAKVIIQETAVPLTENGEFQLTYIVKGYVGDVIWQSDNEAVAVVGVNANIFARSEGTAHITGMLDNGYVSEPCTVTVTAKAPYIVDNSDKHINNTTAGSTVFAQNNATEYTIALRNETYQKQARTLIVDQVKKALNIDIASVSGGSASSYSPDAKMIILNNVELFEAAGLTMPSTDLGDSGYYIKSHGTNVFIMVRNIKALPNAAVGFLQGLLGYDAYACDTQSFTVSAGDTVYMPNFDWIDLPDFEYRIASTKHANEVTATMRSTPISDIYVDLGGQTWHNSLHALKPTEYKEEHPKWYCENWYEGTEAEERKYNQLCYTCRGDQSEIDAMVDVLYEKIKVLFESKPEVNNVTFTIMDSRTGCNCATCKASKEYYGSDSAAIIKVVNAISARLDEYFCPQGRDVKVLFFAYNYTLEAPTKHLDELQCGKNVGVFLAPLDAVYTMSYKTPVNEKVHNLVESWSALCENLYMWVYVTNFGAYFYPFDTYESMTETYKFCYENNALLMYPEGQFNQDTPTAFIRFKEYLESKILWNLNEDYDTLKQKFFDNYFLDASQTMLTYYEELRTHLARVYAGKLTGGTSWYNDGSGQIKEHIAEAKVWPREVLLRWLGYIDQAYEDIEKYQSTDQALYEKLKNHIDLEAIFLKFALCDLHEKAYTEQEIIELRDEFVEFVLSVRQYLLVNEYNNGTVGVRSYEVAAHLDFFTNWGKSLNVETKDIEVQCGTTAQIVATTVNTTTDIHYTSADTSIATVNENGVITGVSEGTTTITVSILVGVKVKVTVTVTQPASFDLNKTSVSGYENDTFKLELINAVGLTGDPVFTSSNNTVATVDENGLITFVATGKAEITVTCSGVTKKCRVTVRQLPRIDIQTTELTVQQESEEQIEFTRISYVGEIYWESDNDAIAVVGGDGHVYGRSEGVAHITSRLETGYEGSVVTVTVTPKQEYIVDNSENHLVNVTATENVFCENNASDYVIICKEETRHTYGRNVIYNAINKALGIKLSMQTGCSNYSANGKMIIINDYDLFEQAGLTMPEKDLGDSGYYIKSHGTNVFIMVKNKIAISNGAVGFLQILIGYDFYALNTETFTVSKGDKVTMPDFDVIEIPDFEYRLNSNRTTTSAIIRYRTTNTNDVYVGLGGRVWHNTVFALDPVKYMNEHPYWYSIKFQSDDPSKLNKENGQLCYTCRGDQDEFNAMVDEVYLLMKAQFDKYPQVNNVTFTIMDNHEECNCNACEAAKAYYGSDSAAVIKFCNAVSEKLDAYYCPQGRDVKVVFFAYNYTTEPPTKHLDEVHCSKNVCVFLAPIDSVFTESFLNPVNERVKTQVEQWGELSENVYLWLYETNYSYYLFPYDAFESMLETYKFCYNHNARLMFPEGQHNNDVVTAFGRFKSYLESKVMWNVNEDYETLKQKFFDGYFMDASDIMLTYFEELRTQMAKIYASKLTGGDIPYYGSGRIYESIEQIRLWPYELLTRWLGYINQAYEDIAYLKDVDIDTYNLIKNHIDIEALFIRFAICDMHVSEFTAEELYSMREEFYRFARYDVDQYIKDNEMSTVGIRESEIVGAWEFATKKWNIDVTEIKGLAELDLETTEFSVAINGTAQIVATKHNISDPITYVSDDTAIATVDENGLITGVANGTVIIRVKVGNIEKTVNVTVLAPSFSLSPSSYSGYEGDTFTLELVNKVGVTGNPIFTSSNNSIATVDENGLVILLSTGKAEITVTCSGYTKKCRVTSREMARVIITDTQTEMVAENEHSLKYAVYGYVGDISWESDNEAVAVVVNGNVYARSEGTANITAILETGYVSAPLQLTVTASQKHLVDNSDKHIINTTAGSTVFATNGASDYVIVGANESRINRAKELIVGAVNRALGITLNTAYGTTYSANGKKIIINDSTLFAQAGLTMPSVDLGDSGYYIKSAGTNVFIMAKNVMGITNGAVGLLQGLLGYDIYAHDTESFTVKAGDTVIMPNFDVIDMPDFDYRLYSARKSDLTKDLMRFTYSNEVYVTLGGRTWHNTLSALPPATYRAEHPSWYCNNWNDESPIDGNQLCYTCRGDQNEYNALVDTLYDMIKAEFIKYPTVNNVTFTIMDNQNRCSCATCEASKDYYGSDSAAVIKLCNAVSERLDEYFCPQGRNVKILFFAYFYTEEAPTNHLDEVHCSKNVGAFIAPIFANYTQTFYSEENEKYAQTISDWASLTENVYMWLYETNYSFYFYPYDAFDSMIETYRFCYNNNARLMFPEGQHNQGVSTAFTKFKDYLESKVMWNVNEDYETLKQNFFTNYFLDASDIMLTYYEELRTQMAKIYASELTGAVDSTRGRIYENVGQSRLWSTALLQKWLGYINQAYAEIDYLKNVDINLYNKIKYHIDIEAIFIRFALCDVCADDFTEQELLQMRRDFITFVDGIESYTATELGYSYGFRTREIAAIGDYKTTWGLN